jgi:hypothetical protein
MASAATKIFPALTAFGFNRPENSFANFDLPHGMEVV